MNIGLVLGAGGPLGWAYHLGVIEGVHSALGQDPTTADRIVGTSAGAAIAAGIVGGSSVAEILDVIATPPTAAERATMRMARDDALRHPLRSLRPMAPNLVANVRNSGLATAAAGMLPSGLFATAPLRRFVPSGVTVWPSQLWVPSVRIDDGRVVVFGRDPITIAVADAVEATSAVPGLFTPKAHDGYRYVDGAVASATHAHTLVGQDLDLVVISSPMTRPGRGPIRARARRQLSAEVAALRAAGVRTIVVSPTIDVLAAAEGFPRHHPENGVVIVEAARRQTVAAFENHAELGHADLRVA